MKQISLCILLKKVLFYCIPIIILSSIYLIIDPFKIIREYDDYYSKNTFININRDFVSTEMFLKNYKKYNLDSFIFGSSTSLCFSPVSWGKYIPTPNHTFSFDASGEQFIGIWSKIKFIKNHGSRIKNALIIFDTDISFAEFHNSGVIFMKHYKVYPTSKFKFHYESFLSFFKFRFLIAVFHYKTSNHFYPYMKAVLDERKHTFDLISNGLNLFSPINEIKNDSVNYYNEREKVFEQNRQPIESKAQINIDHVKMLKEIKQIFKEDSTNYRIIISPLYNQVSFNNKDLEILKTIFGEEFVFDFSGVNEITSDKSNYYDITHFKRYVGEKLLNIVYSSQPRNNQNL
ncbi:MAG: hypothetical protein JW870_05215 [Candidatus Delongbacteria bacterium]|nr:hypothetical protein [Candidatus Delongbacteria bacterium]